jgi:hypothetical protein
VGIFFQEFIGKTETDDWKTRLVAFWVILVEMFGAGTRFVDRRETNIVYN